MFYVLQYPNFTAYDYAARFANRDGAHADYDPLIPLTTAHKTPVSVFYRLSDYCDYAL